MGIGLTIKKGKILLSVQFKSFKCSKVLPLWAPCLKRSFEKETANWKSKEDF